MDRDNNAKICCVGFQKTGTSSMGKALEALGFSVGVVHKAINAALAQPGNHDADEVVRRLSLEVLASVDAIQDSPCPFLYQEFDQAFPGSKFILTTRSTEAWLKSYGSYFPNENSPARKWMYGVDEFKGNEERYARIFERQQQAIRDYFADRPDDFLEFSLENGDSWFELVQFLGKDWPYRFPHANKGANRKEKQRAGSDKMADNKRRGFWPGLRKSPRS